MQNEKINALSDLQKAQIYDLADDQLHGEAFTDALALLETSSQARAVWHTLHVTGDVLRGEPTAHAASNTKNTTFDTTFLDTFRANLAKEPVQTRKELSHALLLELESNTTGIAKPAANDAFFSWKWFGGLSAAAAVVAFSWNMVSTSAIEPSGTGAQLAQSSVQSMEQTPTVETQTSAGVLLRNPQLDALIAAHNQMGGSSALQRPSGFLRSATLMPAATQSTPSALNLDK